MYAGPNVEWMPKPYFADNANQIKADPYTLVNFKIGYSNRKSGWSDYLEGRNLLNRRYIANAAIAGTADVSAALFNPGSCRSVYGGVQFRW
jgi:iron complex outermembrane receptor protein